MLKSVVRTQDFILSLDVEIVFFHVPINVKPQKFLKNSSRRISLCRSLSTTSSSSSRQGVTLSAPDQTSSHWCHSLKRRCTCSTYIIKSSSSPMCAVLPLGWTRSSRIWTNVMSVVTVALLRHAHTVLCRRSADRLKILRGSNTVTASHRGHVSRCGYSPCVTQGLFRYSHTDLDRPSGLHHLQYWRGSGRPPESGLDTPQFVCP